MIIFYYTMGSIPKEHTEAGTNIRPQENPRLFGRFLHQGVDVNYI